jgi:hypothetical protein
MLEGCGAAANCEAADARLRESMIERGGRIALEVDAATGRPA